MEEKEGEIDRDGRASRAAGRRRKDLEIYDGRGLMVQKTKSRLAELKVE